MAVVNPGQAIICLYYYPTDSPERAGRGTVKGKQKVSALTLAKRCYLYKARAKNIPTPC